MTKILHQPNNENFLKLLDEIESNFPLSYNQEINQLFISFQEGLDNLIYFDTNLTKRLNKIWAQRGFSVEKYFAQQQNIQSFDFYPKYKNLLKFDSLMLRKVIGSKKYNKVIFIGSGPLPLTLKLLRLNIQKVGYDLIPKAISLARKSINRDRFGRKIVYHKADFFTINLHEKKPVIIYLAGLILNKKKGIERLIDQLPKGSLIIIRTVANDKRRLLYERLKKEEFYKFGEVKEFNPIHNSGVVNGMIILRLK